MGRTKSKAVKTAQPFGFCPELWSEALVDALKANVHETLVRSKRSRGTQLLRDAALGYPEYPDITDRGTISNAPDTQTHYADAAGYALAVAFDRDILNSARKRR